MVVTYPDCRMVQACFDCDAPSNLIDTVKKRIIGCNKNLVIMKDTALVIFKAENEGAFQFQKITLLSVDKDNILRQHSGAFSYVVIKK